MFLLNNSRVRDIIKLYERTKEEIRQITKSQYSSQLLDALFDRPIFKVNELSKRIQIPKPTAHSLISQLEKSGLIIILKAGAGRRSTTYAFPELLNIAEDAKRYGVPFSEENE